jgi:hypothetical protein
MMKFKSKLLSTAIMLTLAPAAMSSVKSALTDFDEVWGKSPAQVAQEANASGYNVYKIYLSQPAALSETYRSQAMSYKNAAKSIATEQESLSQVIKSRAPSAIILSSSSLTSNSMTVVMTDEAANFVGEDARIGNLIAMSSLSKDELAELKAREQARQAKAENNSTIQSEGNYEDYSNVQGVKVGIVGTGIDFTHEAFGGEGAGDWVPRVYNEETGEYEGERYPEAYTKALEWRTIYDEERMPTSVVFGGVDLYGENSVIDPNPIEENTVNGSYDYRIGEFSRYPAGMGSAMASAILEEAPDAKLFPMKMYRSEIYDIGYDYHYARGPYLPFDFEAAFDRMVDPNGDGDISDRLDIALMNSFTMARASNCHTFMNDLHDVHLKHISVCVILLDAIKVASSSGVLLVADAGFETPKEAANHPWFPGKRQSELGIKMPYGLHNLAVAPHALTVGMAEVNTNESGEQTYFANEFARIGPVRGTEIMKPDMVANMFTDKAAIPGTGNGYQAHKDHGIAAARVAGMAAKLMAAYPELDSQEIKAMLMNTANHFVADSSDNLEVAADISKVGAGYGNIENALATTVLAFEKTSHQPIMNWGAMDFETGKEHRLVKNIVVRNISNSDEIRTISLINNKENPGLSFEYPATVAIPAGGQAVVPVVMKVDASALPLWQDASDFTQWPEDPQTGEKIQQVAAAYINNAMSGFFSFTAEGKPAVDVGWRIAPRPQTSIDKDFYSYSLLNNSPAFFSGKKVANEFYTGIDHYYYGHRMAFENTSAHEKTFVMLPTIMHTDKATQRGVSGPWGANDRNITGYFIESAAAQVIPDQSDTCESGEKLVIGLEFDKPIDVMARYYRWGNAATFGPQFIFKAILMPQQWGMDNGWYDSLHNDTYYPFTYSVDHKDNGAFIHVKYDLETGVPAAYYVDIKSGIAPGEEGYLKASKLPVNFAGNSKSMVVNYCTEELVHDGIQTLDQDFFWFLSSADRAFYSSASTYPVFNPVAGGPSGQEWLDWNQHTQEGTVDNSIRYRAKRFFRLNKVNSDGTEQSDWKNELTLAPGEQAFVNTSWIREWEHSKTLGLHTLDFKRRFSLFTLDGSYSLTATAYPVNTKDDAKPVPTDGQVWEVEENAPAGTVIGRVKLDGEGFFQEIYLSENQGDWYRFDDEILVKSPIYRDAVSVDVNGWITVNNPAALDAEAISEFSFDTSVFFGLYKDFGQVGEVIIRVKNTNDNAPFFVGDAQTNFTLEQGSNVDIRVANMVSDLDGDLLTFTATGLPSGLTLDANTGLISGSTSVAGSHNITITVDDSVHQASGTITLTVPEAESTDSGSSGGSMPVSLLLMLLSLGLVRRKSH